MGVRIAEQRMIVPVITRGRQTFPQETQKLLLKEFWNRFGGKRCSGEGLDRQVKLATLVEFAAIVIPYRNQQTLFTRRTKFQAAVGRRRFKRKKCFVCENKASQSVRHHIIQLQYGGINSKKNIISVCRSCHAEIHPWLKTTAQREPCLYELVQNQ